MQNNDTAEITNTIAAGQMDPVGVYVGMNFITKACVSLALIAGAAALIMAVLPSARGGRSSLLDLLGKVGLVAGVLGGIYDAFVTWQVAGMLHETRLAPLTPSIIESVAAVLIGLIAWLIARFGNSGAKPV